MEQSSSPLWLICVQVPNKPQGVLFFRTWLTLTVYKFKLISKKSSHKGLFWLTNCYLLSYGARNIFAPLRTSCWLETNKCSSLANPVLSWQIQGGLMIVNLTRKSRLNLVKRGAKISEHDSFAMGFMANQPTLP